MKKRKLSPDREYIEHIQGAASRGDRFTYHYEMLHRMLDDAANAVDIAHPDIAKRRLLGIKNLLRKIL